MSLRVLSDSFGTCPEARACALLGMGALQYTECKRRLVLAAALDGSNGVTPPPMRTSTLAARDASPVCSASRQPHSLALPPP